MSLNSSQLREIEISFIRTQQGGRIDLYNPVASGISNELRWSPYKHGNVGLWSGKEWCIMNMDYTNALTSKLDTNGQALLADTNYDVYMKYQTTSSGSLELVRWASSNARSNIPSRFEGVVVYDSTTDIGKSMRYLGAVRLTTVSGVNYFTNTITRRFTVNQDNTILTALKTYHPGGATQTYNTGGPLGLVEVTGVTRGEFLCLYQNNYPCGVNTGSTRTTSPWCYCGCFVNSVNQVVGPYYQGYVSDGGQAGQRDGSAIGYSWIRIGYNYFSIAIGAASSYGFDVGVSPDFRMAGSMMVYT
jgi:hypothetical protein